MMKSAFLSVAVAFASFAWAGSARAGIDFSLCTNQSPADSLIAGCRYISDGNSHIYLRIPNTWKTSGDAGGLDLIPDQPGSRIRMTQVRGVEALPLDEAGLVKLRKLAADSIPDGAKQVKVVGEGSNLLPIFGWKSFEITHRYEFFGHNLRRSVLYVNMLPGRVVQITVTAADADFEDVHEGMRQLMYGWFEPSHDLKPEQARKYESGEYSGG